MMMRATILGFGLLLLHGSLSLAAPNNGVTMSGSVDSLFSFVGPRDPGCAVLVINDGKRVFAKGYGVADLRSSTPITPETNFRLASLTKQFTAMSIMLLLHDGKLRYEERLSDVFPDFPAYGKTITVRQMLNHTSGLIDYEDIMYEDNMDKQYVGIADDKIPQIKDAGVLELLKRQSTTKFAPGSFWSYSNSGYVLLAMIVEKRSGMDFGEFLKRRIFEPLNMANTIAFEKGKNQVSHRAYGNTITSGAWKQTDQSSTSATLGDGGIYTSLNDLEKWDRALSENTLLSEKEMQPGLKAASMPNGAPMLQPNGTLAPRYGFGWFLDPYLGHRRYSHYGETMGFRNSIQRFPDDHLTVIVLSNRAEVDAPALAEKIASLYLKTSNASSSGVIGKTSDKFGQR